MITRYQLNNGLTIQMKEIHTAPLISHWVWYRVGSRNEKPGMTGLSHWVEHMQFKGTPQFPSKVLDKAISRDGGVWNAFTYLDWTTFFETLPADKIELAIQLEADRMTNSLYETHEVESERQVVISERQGSENEPMFRLDEAVQAATFDSHPYRYRVIGEMKDLELIQRDDLYQHYQTYYTPNNAVLSIAGDFETPRMLELLKSYYGHIPAGPALIDEIHPESPLNRERRLNINGPGETTYLQISYRAPSAKMQDFFAFTILDSLLTGPTGLNMFGGGISNKTSRLYRALVEKELAVSITGGLQATIDPFLYEMNITVHPDQRPDAVLAILEQEIQRILQEPVPQQEINRAAKQARALFAYGSENITNQAFWLGFAEMFATYDWFLGYVSELEKVTPLDVQQVAQTYLDPSRRVVGTYTPDPAPEDIQDIRKNTPQIGVPE
jgi:zinc protease